MDDKIDDWLKAKFPIYWDGNIPKELKLPHGIISNFDPKSLTIPLPKEESIDFRKKNGLCLECGEKGKFVNLALVCSKHGVY